MGSPFAEDRDSNSLLASRQDSTDERKEAMRATRAKQKGCFTGMVRFNDSMIH